MPELPNFVWLAATIDNGVALVCDEPSCAPRDQQEAETWGEVAYYGGPLGAGPHAAAGRPYFGQLGEFIDFIYEHVNSHKGPS